MFSARLSRAIQIVIVAILFPPTFLAADPPQEPRTPESAVTPVNRSPRRHAQFLAQIKEGPIDLLFLGASIVEFWPLRGADTWAKFAPDHPANFGVAGERTEDLLWRVENGELDGIHPQVVVLHIGNNNIGQFPDEQPAWVAAGVRRIVDTIHEKLPDSKVLLLAIFPRDAIGSPNRLRNDAVNVEIAKFDDGSKTRYLDIGHVFMDSSGEISRDIMPDLLHPSARGYQLWYDAMQPTLDEMMK